eukprot:TRINITY_DN4716_c0_g1_i1.p1 TRINITY_DN4716_c0_g1~~TRINITY_DN4716_c0_g1_i1.p1  ORF type:complete len:387 (-),score=93.06 TRINITY_DN4716_c0_g1_i1:14-1129(-)
MNKNMEEIIDKEAEKVKGFVLVESTTMPEGSPIVKGPDFNEGVDYSKIFDNYVNIGFQAMNLGLAIEEVNRMINWRMSDEEVKEDDDITDPEERKKVRCTIFLGYTSNMVSSGVREIIRYLVQHKMVDAMVTTCGGIEEDFMKCFNPHYLGDFKLKGSNLRKVGLNRIGNLLVPNNHYVDFEDFVMPILDEMYKEQKEEGTIWTPSTLIDRLGKEIDNEESIYYWAHKNNIPVFCPGITDGSLGDMLYMHSFKQPDYEKDAFIVDVVRDIRKLNSLAVWAPKSGMIILGGGIIKHHICNANLMRNGADYSVYINTGQEFDGSDSGASPEEAISWGKIKIDAQPVKVSCDATIAFPILVGNTFAKNWEPKSE